MVNNYIFQHNNLTQCIRILQHVNHKIQKNSLHQDYSLFYNLARLLKKRTSVDLFHLSNARTSSNVLAYYKKLLLSDTNFYMLHKDVKRYFMIRKQVDDSNYPSLWIVTNHFLNLMSRTDMMTVIDSAYIQLTSQLNNVDVLLNNQRSIA